jgi:hypothetical protein
MAIGSKSMKTGLKRLFQLALAILVLAQAGVFLIYERDQHYLSQLMDKISEPAAPPSVQAQRVLNYLRDVPVITNESYFLSPVFHFMRATPRQVSEQGGDCADRSRLMIALLRTHNIEASKWALYSPEMKPVHAVVEIQTEQGPMVADTLFGITYPKPDAGYYSVAQLRDNPALYRERIAYLQSIHARPGGEKVEQYPLNRYVFENARTINWEKSPVMHLVYRALRGTLGDRANRITRPFVAEQPALMVIVALTAAEAFLLFLWIVLLFVLKKRKSAGFAEFHSHDALASSP